MEEEVKPIEESKPKKRRKKWNVCEYIRQVSVVIIGILITFQGSALIKSCSERSGCNYILSMVKDELEANSIKLENQKKVLKFEYNGSAVIKPYLNRPLSIPTDSLKKYISVLTQSRWLGCTSNSFEVLKSSPLIQTVKSKELLRNLFRVYEEIEQLHGDVSSYNERKEEGMDEYFSLLDSDEYDEAFTSENFYFIFEGLLKNPRIRNYIVATANGNNINGLISNTESLQNEINEIIEMINKEVK